MEAPKCSGLHYAFSTLGRRRLTVANLPSSFLAISPAGGPDSIEKWMPFKPLVAHSVALKNSMHDE